MKKSFLSVFFFAMLFAGVNGQAADKYIVDATHSSVGFAVDYLVISKTSGHFNEFSGHLIWDDNDLSKAKIVGVIKTKSVDTNNKKRDDHLKTEDFFAAEKHPEIKFESTKIVKNGKGYKALGNLTLRGVTKTVEAPFEITGRIKDFAGNPRIGIKSQFNINRKDYGVNWNKSLDNGGVVVSDAVTIYLDIQVVNKGS